MGAGTGFWRTGNGNGKWEREVGEIELKIEN